MKFERNVRLFDASACLSCIAPSTSFVRRLNHGHPERRCICPYAAECWSRDERKRNWPWDSAIFKLLFVVVALHTENDNKSPIMNNVSEGR